MATITITRGLQSLTSAFNQCSIEFTITTGVVPKATINALDYSCVKTITNVGGLDTYIFDLTDKLPYLMGFPPDDFTQVSLYRKSLSVAISGAGATTQTETTYICFGFDIIKEFGSLVADINTQGRRSTCYTNGRVGFYFNGTTGTHTISVGTVTGDYSLVNGYNIITLLSVHQINGLLTIDGYDTEFNIVYIPLKFNSSTNRLIVWIDNDGNYNECDMKFIETIRDIKKSNKISTYKPIMSDVQSFSREITKEKSINYSFYAIAYDTEHYRQLVSISDSIYVYWENKILSVKDSSKTIAECKQNLRFSLTLETEDYVPTY